MREYRFPAYSRDAGQAAVSGDLWIVLYSALQQHPVGDRDQTKKLDRVMTSLEAIGDEKEISGKTCGACGNTTAAGVNWRLQERGGTVLVEDGDHEFVKKVMSEFRTSGVRGGSRRVLVAWDDLADDADKNEVKLEKVDDKRAETA